MGQKHFICTHTFCSEESRRLFLTPPENLNPPSQRLNEKEWSKASKGSYATCLQTWVGNDDFFFCHWIADDEEQIYKQIEAWELDGIIIFTQCTVLCLLIETLMKYNNSLKQGINGKK